jgi:hypothetical protein
MMTAAISTLKACQATIYTGLPHTLRTNPPKLQVRITVGVTVWVGHSKRR